VTPWRPLAWLAATIGLDLLLLLAFLLRHDQADTPYSWVALTVILHGGTLSEASVAPAWMSRVWVFLFPVVVVADVCTWLFNEVLRHRASRGQAANNAGARDDYGASMEATRLENK
jgi:hypothetical protein